MRSVGWWGWGQGAQTRPHSQGTTWRQVAGPGSGYLSMTLPTLAAGMSILGEGMAKARGLAPHEPEWHRARPERQITPVLCLSPTRGPRYFGPQEAGKTQENPSGTERESMWPSAHSLLSSLQEVSLTGFPSRPLHTSRQMQSRNGASLSPCPSSSSSSQSVVPSSPAQCPDPSAPGPLLSHCLCKHPCPEAQAGAYVHHTQALCTRSPRHPSRPSSHRQDVLWGLQPSPAPPLHPAAAKL